MQVLHRPNNDDAVFDCVVNSVRKAVNEIPLNIIKAPGLEDSVGYWRHLHSLKNDAKAKGRNFDLSVWPHDFEFLNLCGIYIFPRQFVSGHCRNTLDVTIRTLSERRDFEFFSWGDDGPGLRKKWDHAIEIVNATGG
jgi:hypothetical protein